MKPNVTKFAVTTPVLLFAAGLVWDGVGVMLVLLAVSWLWAAPGPGIYLYVIAGILLALVVHHFGFLKIVDKNLKRLLQTDEKRCLFGFISWKSYMIIAVMVTIGILLRHSAIPKKDLAILYIGIGLALILSSIRYIRIFFKEMSRRKTA